MKISLFLEFPIKWVLFSSVQFLLVMVKMGMQAEVRLSEENPNQFVRINVQNSLTTCLMKEVRMLSGD